MEYQLAHKCAKHAGVDCMKLVLNTFGIDLIELNSCNSLGQTPLHVAVTRDNTGVVEYLLEFGIDVNITDNEGHSPLYSAVGKM